MSSQLLALGLGTFGHVKYLPTLGLGTASAVVVVSDVVKTGTGGIDPGEGSKRRYIVKPTGLLHLPAKPRPSVQERIDESAGIAADIAGRLAREFAQETVEIAKREVTPVPIAKMSLAQIDQEIGAILRKKLRTEEDEMLLLLIMAASSA